VIIPGARQPGSSERRGKRKASTDHELGQKRSQDAAQLARPGDKAGAWQQAGGVKTGEQQIAPAIHLIDQIFPSLFSFRYDGISYGDTPNAE